MEKGIININGTEYVLGPTGMFVSLDGKLCGYVSSDIARASGLEPNDLGPSLVDVIAKSASKKNKAHPAMPVIIWGVGQIGIAINEYQEMNRAEEEAAQAERRAAEMERRLQEARRRHGQP